MSLRKGSKKGKVNLYGKRFNIRVKLEPKLSQLVFLEPRLILLRKTTLISLRSSSRNLILQIDKERFIKINVSFYLTLVVFLI